MNAARHQSDGMVLPKFLARAGVGSRRACEKLVRAGDVVVNDEPTTEPGTRVRPGVDRVTCRGNVVALADFVYWLLHKPAGCTCSAADAHAERLAVNLLDVPVGVRVFSIGRLDRDSEGLLLFTNDGDLAQRLLHPRYEVSKVYHATVRGQPGTADLRRMTAGIEDKGERLRAERVDVIEPLQAGACVLRLVLRQGRKREVRRLCRAVGCPVQRLVRTAFGPLELGEFRPGFNRALTAAEVALLQGAAGQA